VYVYVGYPLLLLLLAKLKGRDILPNEEYEPEISVIIPAYNEEKWIEQKLQNTAELDYPKEKLEILVASDGSQDRTVELAKRFAQGHGELDIKILDYKERRGKMGNINRAVREATGEILLMTDANAMISSNALRELVKYAYDESVGCVCGAKVVHREGRVGEGEGLYWKYEDLIKRLETKTGSCAGADGALYIVKRELFPYPEDSKMVMDDFAVSLHLLRKGFRCYYNGQARAYENASGGLYDEFRRKGRIFAGCIVALRQAGGALAPWRCRDAWKLWSHKVLRWFGGFLMVGALVGNVALLGKPFYNAVFFLQVLFYMAAGMGAVGVRKKLFYIPMYFLLANMAQIWGLLKLGALVRKPAWEKLER